MKINFNEEKNSESKPKKSFKEIKDIVFDYILVIATLALFLSFCSQKMETNKERELQKQLEKCSIENNVLSEYIDKIYEEHRREIQSIIGGVE